MARRDDDLYIDNYLNSLEQTEAIKAHLDEQLRHTNPEAYSNMKAAERAQQEAAKRERDTWRAPIRTVATVFLGLMIVGWGLEIINGAIVAGLVSSLALCLAVVLAVVPVVWLDIKPRRRWSGYWFAVPFPYLLAALLATGIGAAFAGSTSGTWVGMGAIVLSVVVLFRFERLPGRRANRENRPSPL